MRGAAWLGAAVVLVAAPVRAQVRLQTQVSSRQVEVGEAFQLELMALAPSEDQTPSNPKLVAPPGFDVRGPGISSQTHVSIMNGRMEKSVGINATWTVTANRTGSFRVGPPSVEVAGKRQQGEVVQIEVVPAGSLPRRRPGPGQRGFDPFDFFDPFGRTPFPRGLLPQDNDDSSTELPPVPKELQLDKAPDATAFVRVLVTPEHAVVGQQVTLNVYAYGGRGPFRVQNASEPSRPDFLAFTIDDNDGNDPVRVPIGDDVFIAVRLRQYALFPLSAGKLPIGPVEVVFAGDRYRARQKLERSSAPLEVMVEEPPLAGRPAGYHLGDVGKYQLTASVEPREVTAGDAVSVIARLEGDGNVPSKINVPQQHGVEWLEPTIVSDVEPKGSVVRGSRSFTYVVKLTEAGSVDLGQLSIPFWDPESKTYGVASSALGNVVVKPAAQKPASAAKLPSSPLATLGGPRKALGAGADAKRPLGDGPAFWFLLFGAPLGVVLTDATVRLSRLLLKRRLERRSDPRALALKALAEANAAAKSAPESVPGTLERALFLAIEAGPGLRARALLRSELAPALERAGCAPSDAREVVALLDQCETARFTGAANGNGSELSSKGERLVQALLRQHRARS